MGLDDWEEETSVDSSMRTFSCTEGQGQPPPAN